VEDQLLLRSYRRVFRIERRLYRIEDWRLPLPGGVPLRAVAYFFVAELCVLVLAQLPGAGQALSLLPVEWRYGILPIGCAMAGWWASPDGRPAHRFAVTWLRMQLRHRRRRAGRAVRAEGERLELAEPLVLRSRRGLRGRRLELRPPGSRGEPVDHVVLEEDQTLEVRPA